MIDGSNLDYGWDHPQMISRKSQRPHFTSNSSRFGGMGDIKKPKIKITYCHIQTSNIFYSHLRQIHNASFPTHFHHIILKAGHFLTGWKQKWVLPAAVHQPLGKMRRILNNQWIILAWWIWLTQGTMEVASLSTLWKFSLVSWLFWWESFFFVIAASKRDNKTF